MEINDDTRAEVESVFAGKLSSLSAPTHVKGEINRYQHPLIRILLRSEAAVSPVGNIIVGPNLGARYGYEGDCVSIVGLEGSPEYQMEVIEGCRAAAQELGASHFIVFETFIGSPDIPQECRDFLLDENFERRVERRPDTPDNPYYHLELNPTSVTEDS